MRIRAAVLNESGLPRPYDRSRRLEITELELDPPGLGELMVAVRSARLGTKVAQLAETFGIDREMLCKWVRRTEAELNINGGMFGGMYTSVVTRPGSSLRP